MNSKDILSLISCTATGIGSVPHTDVDNVCNFILERCKDLPYWPQFAKIDVRENMMLQYSENMPCLKIDLEKNELYYDTSANREEELLKFFENLTNLNFDYFKISYEYARGFYTLLEKTKVKNNRLMKGQVIGPITFLYSIIGENDKPIIYDDMLADAIVRGLAMKAVWQAKEIKKIGKVPIIFFDEPSLSGFGSAFMSLERDLATEIINKAIDTIKEHEDIMVGLHCCGNSDWKMLLETKIDIISFDSYGFGQYFVLYPDSIKSFLEREGVIAWGAVPTSEYDEKVTLDTISNRLNESVDALISKGIDKDYILQHSIFTPSCGLGTLNIDIAEKVTELTAELAVRMK